MPEANISDPSPLEFRKFLSGRLNVDASLDPSDELYEPIYEGDPADPVGFIRDDIELSVVQSLNFISGFRGCGKTTELRRLGRTLTDAGFFVARANALEYLPPSEPVDIADVLIVLAGAFSDAIEKQLAIDAEYESYWNRFVHWITTTGVSLQGFTAGTGSKTAAGLNFKFALRERPSFRQELREKMSARLGELRAHVHAFFEEARQLINQKAGRDLNPVFIFDQFEQLRDTRSAGTPVADSVATLIANHRSELRIPFYHVVFTLPPWMKFKLPDLAANIRLIYTVKLWENNLERTRHPAGCATLQRVVQRRFTPEGLHRFFGPDAERLLVPLIDASGGHLRDLILMLRELLLRTRDLPTTEATIRSVVDHMRTSFLPIPGSDAEWLQRIGEVRDDLLPDRSADTLQRMTFFLDTHCALLLRNGREWYDVHPIIRDEVDEIVRRHRSIAAAKQALARPE